MSGHSLHWQTLPGSFDVHHTFALYPSANAYGIPTLAPYHGPPPAWLWPYGTRVQSATPLPPGAMHFWRDDHRFERIWNRPWDTLPTIQRAGWVLTPDFSVYREWPLAIQIYNTYRNRWCGAFWQEQGVTVIPAVSWALPPSYAFAFAGIPPGSVVAVAARGLRSRETRAWFTRGYQALVEQLQPSLVLVHGTLPPDLVALAPIHSYPSTWRGVWSVQRQAATPDTAPPTTEE